MGAAAIVIFVLIGLFAGVNTLISGEDTGVAMGMILVFGGAIAGFIYLMFKEDATGQSNVKESAEDTVNYYREERKIYADWKNDEIDYKEHKKRLEDLNERYGWRGSATRADADARKAAWDAGIKDRATLDEIGAEAKAEHYAEKNKPKPQGNRLDMEKTLATPKGGVAKDGQEVKEKREKPKYENYSSLPDDLFD